MARRKKEMDTSEYNQLPTKNWREALTGTRVDVGLLSQMPNRSMMSKNGQKVRKFDHEQKTFYDVVYDSQYVLEYYYKKLVVPMDFIVGEDFDENAYALFWEKLKDYSIYAQEREIKEGFQDKAEELAKIYPNKTKEQWLEILVNNVMGDKETS